MAIIYEAVYIKAIKGKSTTFLMPGVPYTVFTICTYRKSTSWKEHNLIHNFFSETKKCLLGLFSFGYSVVLLVWVLFLFLFYFKELNSNFPL